MKRDWTKHRQTIKILSGILLLATFFMPVASCTRQVPHPSLKQLHEQQITNELEKLEKKLTRSESHKEDQNKTLDIVRVGKTELYYPYKSFDAKKVDSWKELLGFIWPLPIFVLQVLLRNRARVLILSFVGLGFCFWSALVIFGINMFKELLLGGYLANIAITCLFLVYLVEVVPTSWSFIRSRWRSFRIR